MTSQWQIEYNNARRPHPNKNEILKASVQDLSIVAA
jgi:hypothetical protein